MEQPLSNLEVVADIFDGYRLAEAWDEMFAAPGKPRAAYDALVSVLQPMDPAELRYRADQLARVFTDRGVTFDYAGEERAMPTRPHPAGHRRGGVGPGRRGASASGSGAWRRSSPTSTGRAAPSTTACCPWSLVVTSEKFRREVAGISPPNGVRVHVAGIDLIRDERGKFRVLEDNVRVPSGVSYVLENRLAMTRLFPALFSDQKIHQVDEYPSRLLAALRAAAPHGVADPFVVVLTPGMYNAAYFEHTLLARLMGVELVEGRDLFCWRNRVYVHTTHGRRPVDVDLPPGRRRVARPAAVPPGQPARLPRAGQRGQARHRDDRQRHRQRRGGRQAGLHLPARPHPVLPRRGAGARATSTRTASRTRTCSTGAGRGRRPGAQAGRRRGRRGHRHRPARHRRGTGRAARPRSGPTRGAGWRNGRSRCPPPRCSIGEKLAPRHVDLRPFAVNDGNDVWVLPGGLTRVALPEGELKVNSSQGGGSKDTWVLDRRASAGAARGGQGKAGDGDARGGGRAGAGHAGDHQADRP